MLLEEPVPKPILLKLLDPSKLYNKKKSIYTYELAGIINCLRSRLRRIFLRGYK